MAARRGWVDGAPTAFSAIHNGGRIPDGRGCLADGSYHGIR